MEYYLFIIAIIILFSLVIEQMSEKLGIPALLLFLLMGVLSGNNEGPLYDFAQNTKPIEMICSFALIFIMFYGGFGTNIKEAKPILSKAFSLASFGVAITVFFVAMFCHYILKIGIGESFLIGSILGSTDAASVFNILRYKKLSLKNNTDSLLEVESGSNDPFAYICTLMSILYIQGKLDATYGILFLAKQVVIGIVVAIFISRIFASQFERQKIKDKSINQIIFISIALLSYAIATIFKGNGYLSAYFVGIILGSYEFDEKPQMVNFFDGITSLMQLLLFFLLGLLISPSNLIYNLKTGFYIILFMIFVARPIAVILLMGKNANKNTLSLISFAGIRGAASIVFAMSAINTDLILKNDIYHIVAIVVMLSLIIQGSLLPFISKRLNMIKEEGNILKTFNDYVEEKSINFVSTFIESAHPWKERLLKSLLFPNDIRVMFIKRDDETILPFGDFQIKENDEIVLGGKQYDTSDETIKLKKIIINEEHIWLGQSISNINIDSGKKIILITRNKEQFVPNGSTIFELNDEVIVNLNPVKYHQDLPSVI